MIRKQVYLEPEQARRLEATAAQTGKSEAQIVREILDVSLRAEADEHERQARWERLMVLMRERARLAQGHSRHSRSWTRDELHDRFERSKLGRRLSGAT